MTTETLQPEDLIPGTRVRSINDGSVGVLLADLDCLSPYPSWIERPEECVAVAWDDGTSTAADIDTLTLEKLRPRPPDPDEEWCHWHGKPRRECPCGRPAG